MWNSSVTAETEDELTVTKKIILFLQRERGFHWRDHVFTTLVLSQGEDFLCLKSTEKGLEKESSSKIRFCHVLKKSSFTTLYCQDYPILTDSSFSSEIKN